MKLKTILKSEKEKNQKKEVLCYMHMAKSCQIKNDFCKKKKVVLRKTYSKFHHSKQSSQDPLFPVKVLADLVF